MLMKTGGRPTTHDAEELGAPVGVNVGVGAVLIVAAAFVAVALPESLPVWRYAVLVAAVGGFAAVTLDHVAAGAIAGLGFAVFDGFLVNQLGELSRHGRSDLWRLMALVVAVAVGLAAGEVYRLARFLRETPPAGVAAETAGVDAGGFETKQETRHA